MNDALYEQLVARKPRPKDTVIRILLILALAFILGIGMLFLGFLAVIVTVILAMLVYYFIFQKMNVEYEYTLLNHDMQIDAVYNKAKRKKMMSFDIQQAEIIAPQNSHRLDSMNAAKVRDFSCGTGDGTYAIIIPTDQALTRVLIDPDEKMLQHMQQWMGMKMFRD